MSEVIREMLANKDNVRKQEPQLGPTSAGEREQALKNLFENQMIKAYEVKTAAKCMQPCLTNMESATMSQVESDCMTNCTSKGMETYVWFKYLSLTQ